MGRVKCRLKWVKKYLKRTGRLQTLDVLNKDLKERHKKGEGESSKPSFKIPKNPDRKVKEDRQEKKDRSDRYLIKNEQKDDCKSVKLSFTIQKAPERKKIEIEPPKPKKKAQAAEEKESKTVTIPKEFKKIAKKFGLPEEHLEFFYEQRESFNWEIKKEVVVHCTEPGCKLAIQAAKGCLNDHMISVHDYRDISCGKTDCAFVAYSQKNLNLHHNAFHGHGRTPTKHGKHSCPYSSCNNFFGTTGDLANHVNTHKNIVLSCDFCPYRAVLYQNLSYHLKKHFKIKDHKCEICSSSFTRRGYLAQHKMTVHNTEGFECTYCNLSCATYRKLYLHRKACTERLKHSRLL